MSDPKYNNLSALRAGELREAMKTGVMPNEPQIIYEIMKSNGHMMKREVIKSALAAKLNCDFNTAGEVFDEHRNKLIEENKIERVDHGYYIAI